MQTVKVLPKGQITLPKGIREGLDIKEGDTLLVEKTGAEISIRKGKTIFDFAGTLPNLGISIEQMREAAVTEAAKEHGKGVY